MTEKSQRVAARKKTRVEQWVGTFCSLKTSFRPHLIPARRTMHRAARGSNFASDLKKVRRRELYIYIFLQAVDFVS